MKADFLKPARRASGAFTVAAPFAWLRNIAWNSKYVDSEARRGSGGGGGGEKKKVGLTSLETRTEAKVPFRRYWSGS